MAHPKANLLGWKRPDMIDPRDALMSVALEKLGVPDDHLADITIREAYLEGYFSSWRKILSFWKWIKDFFGKKPPPPLPLTAVEWHDPDQLDQEDTPHCVGFAASQFLNTEPITDHVSNSFAHSIYYECKILDQEPMEENGTTVHSAAKVLQNHSQIGTYVFARTLADIKLWVMTQGSVMVGTDWYTGMFDPNSNGIVNATGVVEGGHAYLILGYDPTTNYFKFQNSWGASWGKNGYFYMNATAWYKIFVNDMYAEALGTTELPLAEVRG